MKDRKEEEEEEKYKAMRNRPAFAVRSFPVCARQNR